jgi:hypothetical protein
MGSYNHVNAILQRGHIWSYVVLSMVRTSSNAGYVGEDYS